MKHFNSLPSQLSLLLIFTLISCGPVIHYVGDNYPPTSTVDVYYAVKDIQRYYTIMGRMTRELIHGEQERKIMIEEAKRSL